MPIVTVKSKFQVVIPRSLREKIRVSVGDILDARAEGGKITFTPKALVDRGIAQSIEDFRKRRSHGPFASHQEFLDSLHGEARKLRAKKTSRSPAR